MELRSYGEGHEPIHAVSADGAAVFIRPLAGEDEPALRAEFARLSSETRYQRFHMHVTALTPEQWRYLLSADGVAHVALVATIDARIVGVGRMIRLPDAPDAAEIAFLVADSEQRRGIGSLLRDALIRTARRQQLRRLYAFVLPENVPIRRLLVRPPLELIADRGEALELALSATASGPSAT